MSRTTLCVATAGLLAVVSVGVLAARRHALGGDVDPQSGPHTWKVTMLVTGTSSGDARLQTAAPLDYGRQHVWGEAWRSRELLEKPPDARHPDRRQIIWTQRAGTRAGPFRARYEFTCDVRFPRPTGAMGELHRKCYAAPQAGEHLELGPRGDGDGESLPELARRLTEGREQSADQTEALFDYVSKEVANEPFVGGAPTSALDCLRDGSGDPAAKSRLLTALLRHRGIPARLATGLTLAEGGEQQVHTWVEAWVHGRWLPLCPFYHHYGKLPPTYLVLGFGDAPVVRGRGVRDLDYAFLVERADAAPTEADASLLRRLFLAGSLHRLPPPEQRLAEFLLLLPAAALIVCVFRNLIGLGSFGTFAPALLGLAFRDMHSLPGLLVFVAILLVGWLLRRVLDRFHLLQVPRSSLLLSLVVAVLVGLVVVANHAALPATRYVPLFPMVILVGMIERFWTLEAEDGAGASFKTLLSTLLIAGTIGLALGHRSVAALLVRYPELLGLVMATQLLLGRYTGYRLSELYRFRDFLRHEPPPAGFPRAA